MISRQGATYETLRYLRAQAIRSTKRLDSVHATAYIHWTASVSRDLEAAEYVFIGRRCDIPPLVSIGRYTMLASHVVIVGQDHTWDLPGTPMQFSGRPPSLPTQIGADAWLGRGVTVLRGVTIGRGAILAAAAVATRDVPPYEVWGGVPARKITRRFPAQQDETRHDKMLSGPLRAPAFANPMGWS